MHLFICLRFLKKEYYAARAVKPSPLLLWYGLVFITGQHSSASASVYQTWAVQFVVGVNLNQEAPIKKNKGQIAPSLQ